MSTKKRHEQDANEGRAQMRRAAKAAGYAEDGEADDWRLWTSARDELVLVREFASGEGETARRAYAAIIAIARPGVRVALTRVGLGGIERIEDSIVTQ